MPEKLRRLSGDDVVKILTSFGFGVTGHRGSHIKLKRSTKGVKQTLTIPRHRELDKGTLRAIFRQACRYIDESDLRPHFYSE